MQSLFQPPTEPSQHVEFYGDTKTAEIFIWNTSAYFSSYFITGPGTRYYKVRWTRAASNDLPVQCPILDINEQGWDGVVQPYILHNHVYAASNALEKGLANSAFIAMHKAQSLLSTLFQQQAPGLLAALIGTLVDLLEQNSQLAKVALQFIVDMALTMLPPTHPLSMIISAFIALPFTTDRMSVWRIMTDVHSKSFAFVQDPAPTEMAGWRYFDGLMRMGHLKEAEDCLDRLFHADRNVKEEDPEYLSEKGIILYEQHQYMEAEIHLRKCLDLTRHVEEQVLAKITESGWSNWCKCIVISLYGLANVLESMDKVEEAKAIWWRRIEFCCAAWGPDDVDTQVAGSDFEDFLLQHDYIEESAALRARFPCLLQQNKLPPECL